MQFLLAYFFIALAVIIIATYTDIKKRVVPDALSYSAIAIGIGIHAIESYFSSSIWPLVFSVGIAAITFACGYGLWKLGVWAGGDVKLFTAIGAISPFNYAVFTQWVLPNAKILAPISIPIFPLTLFILSAIAVLPYGAGIAIRETISNSALRKKVVSELRKNAIELLFFCLAAIGIGIIAERLAISPWIGLAGIIVWGLLGKYRKIAGVALIAIGAWLEPWNALWGFAYLFAVLLAIYSI
ncbi:MAG: A24 family peptidase, partial [archaeon]